MIAYGIAAFLLHEFGHAAATLACGLRIKGLVLNRTGIGIRRESGSPMQNCIITLAGPLVNLLLAALLPGSEWATVNLIWCLVNILPVRSSDGFRAYCCLGR